MESTHRRPAKPRQRSARDPREDILFSELELAIKWARPSILFAVYDSVDVRRKVVRRLARRLSRIGQRVGDFRITAARADVPLSLRAQPGRETTVFMVSGLQQAASVFPNNPYKSLNIRREYLVDARIRAVFWLTEHEAIDLARQAPDFWAFRHRVVDFLSPLVGTADYDRTVRVVAQPGTQDDLNAKIAYRQQLFEELDEGDWVIRYNLHFSLGSLYCQKPDLPQARRHLAAAADLARAAGDPERQLVAMISLGRLVGQLRQFDTAVEIFNQAAMLDPSSPVPHIQLSVLALARGQSDAAREIAMQCTRQFPRDARVWVHLGWLLGGQGDVAGSVAVCRRALELNPESARAWYQLGMLQSMAAESLAALQSLEQACALDGMQGLYWHALAVQLDDLGQSARALTCARRAVRAANPDVAAWLGLGGMLQRRRRLKAAIQCYLQAANLSGLDDSVFVLACAGLSDIWRAKRHANQAEHWRLQAFNRVSKASALARAAYAALCGQAESARESMQQARQTDRWQVHLLRGLPLLAPFG